MMKILFFWRIWNQFSVLMILSVFILSCSVSSTTFSGSSNCHENQITVSTAVRSLKGFLKPLFCAKTLTLIPAVFAAQAEPGYCDQYKKIKGPKLILTWQAGAQPQAVGWMGSTSCTKVSAKAESIAINRTGFGKIPNQLLIVPRDKSLQPKVLTISKNQDKIHFTTKKIPLDEIWLWGNTLSSPCEKDNCPLVPLPYVMGISSVSGTVKGVFLQKLSSKDLLPLRISPAGAIPTPEFVYFKNVSIDGFQVIDKSQNLFAPKKTSWGQSAEIKITPEYKKNLAICPV